MVELTDLLPPDLAERLSSIASIVSGTQVDYEPADLEPATDEHGHEHEHGPMNTPGTFTMTEASGDSGGPTPGAQALMTLLVGQFGGSSGGIYANRDVRGRPGVRSVHGEGRAGDLMIDPAGGDAAAQWLVENADRLGIQRVIWNRRSWDMKRRKWRTYTGVNPHTDHVHWELTPEAAQRTDLFGEMTAGTRPTKAPLDDLASRLDGISDILSGRRSSRDVDASRSKEWGDPIGSMAATFAAARRGKTAGAPVGVADSDRGKLQQYAIGQLARFGWSEREAAALIELVRRESGWNPTAQNPTSTAYGLFQFLNSTWAGVGATKTSDPYRQIDAGLTYIARRYGSPSAALAFHDKHNYY